MKDATDVLPWHIANEMEDTGTIMIPASLYDYITEMQDKMGILDEIAQIAAHSVD